MMYITSFYFNDPSKAYVILIVFNLFVGTTCLITSFLLDMFHSASVLEKADVVVKILFLASPSYCLGRGIMDIAINHYENEYLKLTGQYGDMKSPFDWEITLRTYIVLFIQGFLFFAITMGMEAISRRNMLKIPKFWKSDNGKNSRRSWTPPSLRSTQNEDSSITVERHRVLSGLANDDLIRVDGLTKHYNQNNGRRFVAVDRLTLGLSRGECFGLLGLNGAGKSTTFSMLSGFFTPTSGECWLNSDLLCNEESCSEKVLRSVGYCPQTDPLVDEMTAREHLLFYARIRGILTSEENIIVDSLISRMGLELYADKPSYSYSGGTKRKLSAALALLGDPSVVLLDEPTTGMDPGSRRFLWDLIIDLRRENRLVILTSHSMEECEALCSRLSIMVSGKLRCIGSTQQLKEKFGNGYIILVKLNKRKIGSVYNFKQLLEQSFSKAGFDKDTWKIGSVRLETVEIALSDSKPNLGAIFDMLMALKKSSIILEYSVSQNTLDNVSSAPPLFPFGLIILIFSF